MTTHRHIPESANREPALVITLSQDGYVRLPLETLRAIPLIHLTSAIDDELPASSGAGAHFIPISGYTEWISSTDPVLTLGWDWELQTSHGQLRYARVNHPRSNIMLIDHTDHKDLGFARTRALLAMLIDSIPWQQEVQIHITYRYS